VPSLSNKHKLALALAPWHVKPLSVLNLQLVNGNHEQSELIDVMVESCSSLPRCDEMARRTEQTNPKLLHCKNFNIFKWSTFGGQEFILLLIYSHVQMKYNLE
jgi:hypothetical protein